MLVLVVPWRSLWCRNTPIRRRVQADVLCDALAKLLLDDCPDKAELTRLLAKLPSEGKGSNDCLGAVAMKFSDRAGENTLGLHKRKEMASAL